MEIFVVWLPSVLQLYTNKSENKQQVLLYTMSIVSLLSIPAFHSFCTLVQPLSVFQ